MKEIIARDEYGSVTILTDHDLYTGKNDINDMPIFENDIIWLACTERAKVIYESCQFKAEILEGDFAGRKEQLGYWKQNELKKEVENE